MRSKIYLIAFLMIGGFVISCSSDDDLNYQNDFEKSREAWLNFKEQSGNSYKYTVIGSSWVGFSWETTITVADGKVIQRHFKYVAPGDLGDIPEEDVEWIEDGQEVGGHKNQAAEPLTLDDIYAKAESEWLIKRNNANTYFETGNNGMISSCGYVINGCMDDCFIGIHINNIDKLSL
ncbi:hypothetical protein [Gelidibacter gilvus]|uniref:Uncharacterized protein n=1 Tax=Gelidibacter gilvus TaxID=59602 RepID=A0A4V1LMS3_9FLAO|nr:hypothetical protein [Gelidibacter gilvus]RXJ49496.1 hypothetical protein ESZ48_12870 [Gelidibacter gilvus]